MYKLKEEMHTCYQLIRYSRSCGSYHAFFDIWLLLTSHQDGRHLTLLNRYLSPGL